MSELEALRRAEQKARRRMLDARYEAEDALLLAKLAYKEHAAALERLKSYILNGPPTGANRE